MVSFPVIISSMGLFLCGCHSHPGIWLDSHPARHVTVAHHWSLDNEVDSGTASVTQQMPPVPPADPDDRQVPIVVLVATRELTMLSENIIVTVETQLADLPVEFRIVRRDHLPAALADQEAVAMEIAEKTGALATLWCDFAIQEKIYFYIASERGERILVRRLKDSVNAMFDETLAIIIRSSVDALLKRGEIVVGGEIEQLPVPESSPAPSLNPRAAEAAPIVVNEVETRLGVRLAYALRMIATESLTIHGGSAGIDMDLFRPLSLSIGLALFAPATTKRSGLELALLRVPMELGIRATFSVGPIRISGGLAFETEIIRETIRSSRAAMVASDDETVVQLSILPKLTIAIPLAGSLGLFGEVGGRIPFDQTTYTLDEGAGATELLRPWQVQPAFLLGVLTTL